jgi:glycosyltransferase involved in cell wall biosynthesis
MAKHTSRLSVAFILYVVYMKAGMRCESRSIGHSSIVARGRHRDICINVGGKAASNGIPTDTFRPGTSVLRRRYGIPANAFVIGYAGRFTFDKLRPGLRICRLIQAYASHHRNVYLMVAGRGSKKAVVERKNTIVMGHMSGMQTFYTTCDLMIGTGRVALECLACGVPTIAVGTRRYVGLITPNNLVKAVEYNFGDHAGDFLAWPDAKLSIAIRQVHQNADQLTADCTRLRAVMTRRFSTDNVVRRIARLYS